VERVLWPAEFPGVPLTNWHRDRLKELQDSIVNNAPKTLDLWARGSFKTTFISRYSNIWRYLRDPNITILQRHGDAVKAEGIVGGCKQHHMHNPVFRHLFSDYCPEKGQKWGTVDEFNLPNSRNFSPEPTMRGRGIEANLTGDHYRHVSDDDIENEININTPETRLKLIRKWEDTPSLLCKPPVYNGSHAMVGTTWHAAGLWLGHIVPKFGPDSDAPAHKKVVQRFYPACDSKLNPLMPEIYSRQALEDLLYEEGPYKFSANYLLRPTDPETAIFKEEWIQFEDYPKDRQRHDKWWLTHCKMRRVISIDLAVSTDRASDMSAYIIVDMDDVGRWYIRECFAGRIEVELFIRRLQDLHREWDFDSVYIEAEACQMYFSKWLRKANVEEGISMPIIPVKLRQKGKQAKGMRILACQPRWHRKDVKIVEGAKGSTTLVHDMVNYPAIGHDDLLDAMAQLEVVEGKGTKKARREVPVGSLKHLQEMSEPGPTRRVGNWWGNQTQRRNIVTLRRQAGQRVF